MTRSELFVKGNDLRNPKYDLNRASLFAEWSCEVLPLLGFKDLSVKFGYVTTDNRGWPLFGVKRVVATNPNNLSETELDFTFKTGPLVNLQDCGVSFPYSDGNTQDQELLSFWIKILFTSAEAFKRATWGSILIEKEGYRIGFM